MSIEKSPRLRIAKEKVELAKNVTGNLGNCIASFVIATDRDRTTDSPHIPIMGPEEGYEFMTSALEYLDAAREILNEVRATIVAKQLECDDAISANERRVDPVPSERKVRTDPSLLGSDHGGLQHASGGEDPRS